MIRSQGERASITDMSTRLSLNQYDTPDELYASLARVFDENENNGTRWVSFVADDVTLTFFASKTPSAESLNDELDAQDEEDPNEDIEVPW